MVGLLPDSKMLKGLFVPLSTIRLRLVPLLKASRRTRIESACREVALHLCLQLDSVSYLRDELFQSGGAVSQTTLLLWPETYSLSEEDGLLPLLLLQRVHQSHNVADDEHDLLNGNK